MAEPFIAEIRIFAGNFAPRGWAFCNGQLMPISQNTALFSLIGTFYGGDGISTTALPNMQGRAPMHPDRGPGLSPRYLGEMVGESSVTLNINEIPSHFHNGVASNDAADSRVTGQNILGAQPGRGGALFKKTPQSFNRLIPTGLNGGGGAHNNLQPYLSLNFIIALVGLYPSRG